MITRTQISFVASGSNFRPSTLRAPFSQSEEPGAIGISGRYRGMPVPEGSASLRVPETEQDGIRYLCHLVLPLMPSLRCAGATDFFVHITYSYKQQCSLGFDSQEMQMLAELGCEVSIDCVEEDPEGES